MYREGAYLLQHIWWDHESPESMIHTSCMIYGTKPTIKRESRLMHQSGHIS